MRGISLLALALATHLGVAAETASADITPDPAKYSVSLATAVFDRHYNAVWNVIDLTDRNAVSKASWTACVGKFVTDTAADRIVKISWAGTRHLPTTLPLLGHVQLQDIRLQVLYTSHGTKTLQATVLEAFWIEVHGKWVAVWIPAQYDAYKVGKCSPDSLY